MIIVIPGHFHSLNEFIDANRRSRGSWNAGNTMKQKDQNKIISYLPRTKFKKPIFLEYVFYEPSARRDKDNVSGYFHKIFQDALVEAGIIKNDGWRNIIGFSDSFYVDQKNPRIEIYIEEKL